jgi:hypothetical protein
MAAREKIEKLVKEENEITDIAAEFTVFLRGNMIASGNDAYFDYLNYLIEDEANKADKNGNRRMVEALEQIMQRYTRRVFLNIIILL